MSVTIKLRKGLASEWTTNSSIVLASGEPGLEIDTGRLKIGNGTTQWGSLQYASIIPSGFIAGTGVAINLGANGSTATISVSGLINNPTNNRILTSRDSTTTGIDAESNLTFNGSLLSVSGNLVVNTGNLDVLYFNTNIEPTLLQGQMAWNDTAGTADIALTDTAIINVGEHEMFRVRNETGGILYKGQAVMASGVHANGIILPNLYTANGSVREIRFMGLVYENVNDNNNGYVIHFGHVNNIDTRGNVASNIAVGDETWADGDILYVHPTVAGKLTKVEPKHNISVAIILDAASNGKIFVRPTSYGHLEDNHDVNVSGVTDGQYLQYNAATDYWIPTSSGTFSVVNVDNLRLDGNTISSTSGNIIISPSGTGALQRDSGGDARGQYSVDWQVVRSTGTMVANGNYSVIGGGRNNGVVPSDSTIGGGSSNTISGSSASNSTIGGGSSNTITGSSAYDSTIGGGSSNSISGIAPFRSTIGGGNNNSISGNFAFRSTIGGGNSNSISGSGASNSTIGGGYDNSISGSSASSSTIGGGYDNSISGNDTFRSTIGGGNSNSISGSTAFRSTIGGGNNNTITGSSANNSTIGGGSYNTISGTNATYSTIPGGFRAAATRYGELCHAAGQFAAQGDAQHTVLIARRLTTNATANQVLFLDNSSSRLTLPAETTWAFTVKLSAYNDTDNEGGWWIFRGGIRRNAANGTALIGSLITESGFESSFNTASTSVVADDTNEALEIRVTGVASKNIRWVAVVDISQVSYGTP
jgi:hypothetical protein